MLAVTGIYLGVAIAALIWTQAGKATKERGTSATTLALADSALDQAATQINADLPLMVDPETRWDTATSVNGALHYSFTMVNYSAREVNATLLETHLRPILAKRFCDSEKMKPLFEHGVNRIINYKGNDGVNVATVTVTPDDCGY